MAAIAFNPDQLGKQEGGPGRTKIYRAIKDGKLRAYKDGRRTIVLAASTSAGSPMETTDALSAFTNDQCPLSDNSGQI